MNVETSSIPEAQLQYKDTPAEVPLQYLIPNVGPLE